MNWRDRSHSLTPHAVAGGLRVVGHGPARAIPRFVQGRPPNSGDSTITVQFGFDTKDGMDAWDPGRIPLVRRKVEAIPVQQDPGGRGIGERLALLQSRAGLTNAADATRGPMGETVPGVPPRGPRIPGRMSELGTAPGGTDEAEAGRLLRTPRPRRRVIRFASSPFPGGWWDRCSSVGGIQGRRGPRKSSAEKQGGHPKEVAEARQALDWAVESAPDDLDARIQRLMFHWFRALE